MRVIVETKDALRPRQILTDRAGNIYVLYEQNKRTPSTDDWWVVLCRFDPNWTLTGKKELFPKPGFKGGDGASMTFAGKDALVLFGIHTALASDPTRHYEGLGERIEGFVLAPYDTSGVQMGAPTAMNFSGQADSGSGGTAPMTEAEKQAVAKAVVDELERRMGGTLREQFEGKVKDALREMGVMTEAMFAGGSGSHVVYQQLINTSYTGAKSALQEGN